MHHDARRYWAWFLSGAVLDAALAMTALLAALVFAPPLLQDGASWRWRVALLGSALALVHLIMLPILIWPAHRLSARDLGVVLVRAATIPLAALFGIVVGTAAGFGSFIPLMGVAALFAAPLSRTAGDVIGGALILVAFAVGLFVGGAVCCGLVAHSARRASPDQVPIRECTAVLGGGVAALVLVVVGALHTMRQLFDLDAAALLRAGAAITAAGLPHLLLTCRDLARQSAVLATPLVAARRVLVLLAASNGLLLRLIYS